MPTTPEFPDRATLEAAICRTAFYYCQLSSLAATLHAAAARHALDSAPTDLQRSELIAQYNRAKQSAAHLYAELERLTALLCELPTPPSTPRTMPGNARN